MHFLTQMRRSEREAMLFLGLVLASLIAILVAVLRADTPPPRTLDQCETEVLDLRSALVDAQEQVALWQARAISAEAKLARQAIEAARAQRQAKPEESKVKPKPEEPKP